LIWNDREMIFCQVSTALSSILGSVTGAAKEMMLSLFPKDYFREIFITTTLTSNQEKEHTDEVVVKRLPMLSIAPGYIPGNDDTIMGGQPLWRRGIKPFRDGEGNYAKIFNNTQDFITVWAIPYRIKFSMDYKIKVSSFFEKIDCTQYLRQKMENGTKFFYNNVLLEAQLPNVIVKAIANIKGYDLNKNDDVNALYNYLKQYSSGYITRKINRATGNQTFFFKFNVNFLVSVTNGAESDGKTREKINQVDGDSIIEMGTEMELWIPTSFIFECKTLPKDDYNVYERNDKVHLDYTFKMRPKSTRGLRTEVAFSTILTDINIKTDSVNFKTLLDQDFIDIIENRIKAGDTPYVDDLFEVVAYRDNTELAYKKDYYVDWKSFTLYINNPYFNYVYSIGIYADVKKLNELIMMSRGTIVPDPKVYKS